jgi:hypothetical protein
VDGRLLGRGGLVGRRPAWFVGRPEVDPAWFTVEETAPDAGEQIAKAKAVCRGCPVRLLCRIHGDETREYGVYNAETYSERIRRLRRWERLGLPA